MWKPTFEIKLALATWTFTALLVSVSFQNLQTWWQDSRTKENKLEQMANHTHGPVQTATVDGKVVRLEIRVDTDRPMEQFLAKRNLDPLRLPASEPVEVIFER